MWVFFFFKFYFNILICPAFIVPWILVLWYPAEWLQVICLIMAVVCTFYKRPLKPSCCEKLLSAVFVPVSSVISQIVHHPRKLWLNLWNPVTESLPVYPSFIQKQVLAATGKKSASVFLVFSRAAGSLTAGKTRGSYLVEKKMLANEKEKNLGEHSTSPVQK